MTRYHTTASGNVPFSANEEIEADQREAAWLAGAAQRAKDAQNAPIIAQIAALDIKRIRPIAEGDAAYLAIINQQVLALRAQLVK